MSDPSQEDDAKNAPGAPETSQGDAAPPAELSPQVQRRRKFLTRVTLGLGAISVLSIVWTLVGYVLAPIVGKAQEPWRAVGSVDDFPVGSTNLVTFQNSAFENWAGKAGRTAAWLRRDDMTTFVCFSINCTHLGCPVRWEAGSELFMCPCHGGVYYRDGQVAAGPPPKPLPHYGVRIRNGKVEVQASPIPITRGV